MNKKSHLPRRQRYYALMHRRLSISFIVGALSVSAGMSVWQSTAWSAIVIAGSAQMLALNMLKTGATLGVIIFTTLIINLRHVLYSASISGTVREASFLKNALCPMRSPTRCMPPPSKRWKEIKRKNISFMVPR
ncbi:AzlC family protein [Klebsiella pneumoniae]|uniref:AzlC family protein n=1 Tax=Klebsiella pneumoniae TaxID=573 RepID=A0A2X3CM41_KLEPN|nr:AzlC family protein [Klebsiella pneumoniae]